MRAVTYEGLMADNPSPFDGIASKEEREITFRVGTPEGVRFDLALLSSGFTRPIDWLWPGRIPLGRVTLIEGPAGVGKSCVALDLAARLCSDQPWPDGTPQLKPGSNAIVVCRQDNTYDVVAARLQAAGADADRYVQFDDFSMIIDKHAPLQIRPVSLPFDLRALARLLDRDKSIRLIVIDPLSDFCSGKKVLAETIHELNQMASLRRIAIVVTLRATARFDRQGQLVVKSRHDTEAARCTWCCVPDPEDPTRQLFLPTLMTISRLPQGMAFRLGELRIDWDSEPIDPRHPLPSESACATWLREFLQEGDQLATVVKRLGKDFDFSEGQLHRASHEIKVHKKRDGFSKGSQVYWSIGVGIVRPDDAVADKPQGAVDESGIATADDGLKDDRQTEAKLPTDEKPTDEETTEGMPHEERHADQRPDDEPRENERQADEPHADRDHETRDADEVAWPGSREEREQTERIVTAQHAECQAALAACGVRPAHEPPSPVDSNHPSALWIDTPWDGSPSSRLNPLGALLDQPFKPGALRRNVEGLTSL